MWCAYRAVNGALGSSRRRRNQRFEQTDQFRDPFGREQPNSILDDFAIVVRQHVSLRHDPMPRNPGMLGFERFRHAAGRLTDDLDRAFHGKLRPPIGEITRQRVTLNEIARGSCCRKHVPEERCVTFLRRDRQRVFPEGCGSGGTGFE